MEHFDHPTPISMMYNGRFWTLHTFVIALGGGGGRGLIVPFNSVQDCSISPVLQA